MDRQHGVYPRKAFLSCLLTGFLLILLSLSAAVTFCALRVEIFETQLLTHVNASALGTDEESLRVFAQETIGYLRGQLHSWNPHFSVFGVSVEGLIPQSFRSHMHTVQKGVAFAIRAMWAGLGLCVLLLLYASLPRKNPPRSPFSRKGFYIGAGVALGIIAALGLWAALDFETFWRILHETLIPDGIFSAAEMIMLFFPLSLFAGYALPVGLLFGLGVGVTLALPLLLSRPSPKAK